MRRTNIYLDDEKLKVLKHMAVLRGGRTTVSDLVRQAVDLYIVDQLEGQQAWGQRLDRLVNRVRSRIPAELSPDDIKADITAESDDLGQEERAGSH